MPQRDYLVVDGGMGRELRNRAPNLVTNSIWSANVLIEDPNLVKELHTDFIKSGARVITANNYACTPQFLAKGGIEDKLDELTHRALKLVCEARDESGVEGVKTIASLPPLNESYRADLVSNVDELMPTYDHLVSLINQHPIDIILCETMSSKEEAFAAALAASKSGKTVWVSWTLRDDLSGLLRSGDTVEDAYELLQDLPVSAYLFNCCVPEAIEQALPVLMKLTNKPVGAMPNCFAPIPTDWTLDGVQGFRDVREDMRPLDYAGYLRGWVDKGALIVGGCCGIGPGHIEVMAADLGDTLMSFETPGSDLYK
jgi:S-methylmethionine-dependent homocysteine/selenocysteine methylase